MIVKSYYIASVLIFLREVIIAMIPCLIIVTLRFRTK